MCVISHCAWGKRWFPGQKPVTVSAGGPRFLSSADNILQQTFYDRERRHDRFLDSVTEQTLHEFDDYSIDAVLREIPFYTERELPDTEVRLPINRRKTRVEVSDIDLGIVDLENRVIGVYEVKPEVAEKPTARRQLEDFADQMERVNDIYGTDWRVTGHVVNADHLNEPYLSPQWYDSGIYGTRDSLRDVFTERDFVVVEKEIFPGLENEEVFTEW